MQYIFYLFLFALLPDKWNRNLLGYTVSNQIILATAKLRKKIKYIISFDLYDLL